MTDAKLDLDADLKASCETLIRETSDRICSPLRTFLDRSMVFLSNPAAKDLPTQDWAGPDAVSRTATEFEDGAKSIMSEVFQKLTTYLDDERALDVLLPPIQESVVDTYTSFYNLVRSEYDLSVSSVLKTSGVVRLEIQSYR